MLEDRKLCLHVKHLSLSFLKPKTGLSNKIRVFISTVFFLVDPVDAFLNAFYESLFTVLIILYPKPLHYLHRNTPRRVTS